MKCKLLLILAGLWFMLITGDIIKADPLPSWKEERIELSLRSSPGAAYKTTLPVSSPKWKKWLETLERAENPAQSGPAYSVFELSVNKDKTNGRIYRVVSGETGLILVQLNSRMAFRVPEQMKAKMEQLRQELADKHYGKALSWPEADKLMPKGTVLTITDLETGLTFRGQRRAGSAHMDVQPLTKEDTATMKSIYGGRWSWQRKAVLVGTPDGMAGASMHGMPHGGDGIPGNHFNGHFCVHFTGSVTHGSSHSDPAHQAMAHKAAGKLEDYHKSLSPEDTVKLFLVAANQKDRHLLEVLLHAGADAGLAAEWLDDTILNARPIAEPPAPFRIAEDTLQARFKMRVGISRKGARPQGIWFWWSLTRATPAGAWFITDIQPEAVIR